MKTYSILKDPVWKVREGKLKKMWRRVDAASAYGCSRSKREFDPKVFDELWTEWLRMIDEPFTLTEMR